MKKLTHQDLMSLEEYAKQRPDFRAKVMAHKKNRRVAIGDHAAMYFEDALTMQYQVQEMLRIERIFEQQGIQDELDVYNSLIPSGKNLKGTFMIEYPNEQERRQALAKLIGIERALYLQIDGYQPVNPIANEDLERETEDKTSAVHFVRFEFTDNMIQAAKQGAKITAGINHPNYQYSTELSDEVRQTLVSDFD